MRLRIAIAVLSIALTAGSAAAQIHAVSPSVTSMGPGGQLAPAPFPSVTSLGPLGTFGSPFFPPNQQPFRFFRHDGFRRRPRPGSVPFAAAPFVSVPIYIPYATYPFYPMLDASAAGYDYPYTDAERCVLAGFSASDCERLARLAADPGAAAERVPVATPAPAAMETPVSAPAQPAADEPPTVLVFRDGHRVELQNYAIVGATLFNFSGNGPRKIPISDLDVGATTAANEDRGVEFRLPR